MTTSSRPASRPPSGWSVLWDLARGSRWRMALLAIVSFVGAMVEAAFLVLVTATLLGLTKGQHTIGPILGHRLSVPAALLLAAGAVVVRLALNLLGVRVGADLSAIVRTSQRRRLAHSYLHTTWAVQQSESSGRLQELLTSFVGRVNSAMAATIQAVTAGLSLLAFLGAGLFVAPVATLAVLGSLALLGTLLAPLRRGIRRHATTGAGADIAFATTISELGSLGQEMQTFGVREQFIDRLDTVIVGATESQRRVQLLSGALAPMYTFFAYAAVVGAIALVNALGVDDFAAIGSVMLLMLRSLSYGQQLSSVLGTVVASLPSLEQLEETIARYESTPATTGVAIPTAVVPVTATGVTFGYSPDRPALRDLDLTIAPGELLGVIGPSGAGKSTLVQLLLGLRDAQAGDIRVGDIDLTTVDRTWWSRRVAFVPQDAQLFTGTVAENIRFFRDGLTDADLRRAAEQANVLADIEALPAGFDTHIGERGSALSGGQRQRLSIARALAGSPELIVMDEPTSALDGTSEAFIRATIADLHGRVTIVIIAHRMTTVELCDRIMVIEGGRVTGVDSRESLRRDSAFYRTALETSGMA